MLRLHLRDADKLCHWLVALNSTGDLGYTVVGIRDRDGADLAAC